MFDRYRTRAHRIMMLADPAHSIAEYDLQMHPRE
jgi:hypothetical protein